MTLLETLALLTLLATVSFGIFDIAWKIFNIKVQTQEDSNEVLKSPLAVCQTARSLFVL